MKEKVLNYKMADAPLRRPLTAEVSIVKSNVILACLLVAAAGLVKLCEGHEMT